MKSLEKSAMACGSHEEAKCKLVAFHSLPEYLKDNEFVENYYRADWPMKETVLSIFSIHNETLNIWTYLIGFFVFLFLTICTLCMMEWDDVAGLSIPETLILVSNRYFPTTQQPVTRWPFFAFLTCAMLCLFASSACHLFPCHSDRCAYAMLRLDYAGISALIVTSFYPLVYYTFMCDPFFCRLYIGFITVFGVAAVLVSLLPVFRTPGYRSVRALLFFCMAVSGIVPIVHKVVAFGDRPEAIITTWYESVMGIFYGLGVVVYATRVPERWMPGKFDIVGHSHQVFHVLVIAGAYTHYLAGMEYLKWRDVQGYC